MEGDQLLVVTANSSFEGHIVPGNYDYIDSYITHECFPVTFEQVGNWEWRLFHFDRDVSYQTAIQLMKKDGYIAGAIGHILAFGEKYPEVQYEFPVVGLGSVAKIGAYRYAPELWENDGSRVLLRSLFDNAWPPYYRFLGVRGFPGPLVA